MGPFRIDRAKVERYLLDPHHPVGGPKCFLFVRYGFDVGRPDDLIRALLKHVHDHHRSSTLVPSIVRQKRVVTGGLKTPSGLVPNAVSVWEQAEDHERLITAYIR